MQKYIIFELKKYREDFLMVLKIDAEFEEKQTCAFKIDINNLANVHRVKNKDFIWESKMAELNQNKNSKQAHRPNVV